MITDNTQELDDLCPICNGSVWQMNAEYEEVPCWHDIHDKGIKQSILDWHNKQLENYKGIIKMADKFTFEDGMIMYSEKVRKRLAQLEKVARIENSKSLCGCRMCEHHSTAYEHLKGVDSHGK